MSTDLTSLLTRHTIECTGPGEVTCRGCRDRGWMSWAAYHVHVAAVVMNSDWLAEHDREVAAGAVDAAADDIDSGIYGWALPNGSLNEWDHDDEYAEEVEVRDWLHDHAQAIREGRA